MVARRILHTLIHFKFVSVWNTRRIFPCFRTPCSKNWTKCIPPSAYLSIWVRYGTSRLLSVLPKSQQMFGRWFKVRITPLDSALPSAKIWNQNICEAITSRTSGDLKMWKDRKITRIVHPVHNCKNILFCTPDWLHSHRRARGLYWKTVFVFSHLWFCHCSRFVRCVCLKLETSLPVVTDRKERVE